MYEYSQFILIILILSSDAQNYEQLFPVAVLGYKHGSCLYLPENAYMEIITMYIDLLP